ncbi:hypothetical protein NBRC116590_02820 [Pelagimonas sp. KU-00592-HH]|uniref:DUF6651 domain-containing protein n=1 Tax=Pelagimonas sp. KU-00592-HH TaxID=3127651 RepID=UPI0031025E34
MDLKTVEIEGKTYAEVRDGKPVYVDDGKEIAFDVVHTTKTVTRLNGEAQGHREAKEAAEAKLKTFEGIESPEDAIKALETVKNLDDKKLIDAGEVDKVKAEVSKVYEEKLDAKDQEIGNLKTTLNDKMIGDSFSNSKFVEENIAVPKSLVRSEFSKNFSIEDGNVVAKDASGNLIYSKEKPGEPAAFEEALGILVSSHPDSEHLLKEKGSGGGGAKQRDRGGDGNHSNPLASKIPGFGDLPEK